MDFFYQHGIESLAEKFGLEAPEVRSLVKYAAAVGELNPSQVVKVLWASEKSTVKNLLKLLKSIPEPPEEADVPDPAEIRPYSRKISIHSPQEEPTGDVAGLFSIPAGASEPTSSLQ